MTDPLTLTDIQVTFPDGPDRRVVLDHLDLSVAAGELVVVAGESGSGKSTLLTVAGLLRRADAGEVVVAGIVATERSERQRTALRRDHIAFIYQSANLLPSLTALEQLQLVGHIRGERSGPTRDRARQLLAELGLEERAGQLPNELSGGERQRVGIGRALMASPDVLIADEPTASLDPDRARSVAAIIAEAAHERGIATLVVAHDSAAREHADRHLRLEGGTLREAEPSTTGGESDDTAGTADPSS